MKGIPRVLLALTILFFILLIVSMFIDWVSIHYDAIRYGASIWSDSAADVKYVMIPLSVIGIVVAVFGLVLEGKEKIINIILLVISISKGLLGIFYYSQQQTDVNKLQESGFDLQFSTEVGFYLFITFFVFILLFQIIGLILPAEE